MEELDELGRTFPILLKELGESTRELDELYWENPVSIEKEKLGELDREFMILLFMGTRRVEG